VSCDETPLIKLGPKKLKPGEERAERYLLVACTALYTHYVLGDRSLDTFKAFVLKDLAARLLLEVLRDRETDVVRFAHDLTVPPTSNQAERDLRPSKVQQNVSRRLTSDQRTQGRYTNPRSPLHHRQARSAGPRAGWTYTDSMAWLPGGPALRCGAVTACLVMCGLSWLW
jgi:hypothetical protein